MTARAALVEVFASIQGEGRFVGVPMVFLRTAACPIRCLYCDTPYGFTARPRFPVRAGGRAREEANPVSAERAAALVEEVRAGSPAAPAHLTLTGGEPLLHPGFLREVGRRARDGGLRVHLETAALHPDALREVLDAVDHVSADYKLPGTLEAGDYADRHAACIRDAVAAGVSVDVKVVVTPAVSAADLGRALDDLGAVRAGILLVLQPVTPFASVDRPPSADLLQACVAEAAARDYDHRVIPQVHRALGVE